MFQAAMDELGVEVKVEELELATWIDRIVTTDEYDISWDYHFQRAVDPAWTLSLAFFYPPGPQNISRYEDDEMTELIAQGGSELDQDEARRRTTTSSRSAGTRSPRHHRRRVPPLPRVAADVEGFATESALLPGLPHGLAER